MTESQPAQMSPVRKKLMDEISLLSPDLDDDDDSTVYTCQPETTVTKVHFNTPSKPHSPVKHNHVVFADLSGSNRYRSELIPASGDAAPQGRSYRAASLPPPVIKVTRTNRRKSSATKVVSPLVSDRSNWQKETDKVQVKNSSAHNALGTKGILRSPEAKPSVLKKSRESVNDQRYNDISNNLPAQKCSPVSQKPNDTILKSPYGNDLQGCLKKSPGKDLRVAFCEPIVTSGNSPPLRRDGRYIHQTDDIFLGSSSGGYRSTSQHVTASTSSPYYSELSGTSPTVKGPEMNFTRAANMSLAGTSSPSPVSQTIELSTLKFADSPSVEETLSDWYIFPAPRSGPNRPVTSSSNLATSSASTCTSTNDTSANGDASVSPSSPFLSPLFHSFPQTNGANETAFGNGPDSSMTNSNTSPLAPADGRRELTENHSPVRASTAGGAVEPCEASVFSPLCGEDSASGKGAASNDVRSQLDDHSRQAFDINHSDSGEYKNSRDRFIAGIQNDQYFVNQTAQAYSDPHPYFAQNGQPNFHNDAHGQPYLDHDVYGVGQKDLNYQYGCGSDRRVSQDGWFIGRRESYKPPIHEENIHQQYARNTHNDHHIRFQDINYEDPQQQHYHDGSQGYAQQQHHYHQHRPYYQQQQQQQHHYFPNHQHYLPPQPHYYNPYHLPPQGPRCALPCALPHPHNSSNRRLPDYVTIDQCYTGDNDTETSTICLIASFDAGSDKENQDGTGVSTGPNLKSRGSSGEPLSRKDRVSLRRGIMLRQMSLNPTHEADLHALAEIRANESGQQQTDYQVGPSSSDPWDDSHDKSRRQSSCSFARQVVYPSTNMTSATASGSGIAMTVGLTEGMDSSVKNEENGSPQKDGTLSDVRRGSNTVLSEHQPNALDRQSQQLPPLTNTASPTTKMKMKNLGLSNSSAAMRFRLTFDESSDAAANNNIVLPPDVNPQVLPNKRPSCICGEPELPPDPSAFSKYQTADPEIVIHPPSAEPPPLCDSDIPYLQSASHSSLSSASPSSTSPSTTNIVRSYSPSPGSYSVRPTHSLPSLDDAKLSSTHSLPNDPHAISAADLNSIENEHNVSTIQTQSQGAHPKVTICISNSQQSFIPYNCDSYDTGIDDVLNTTDYHDNHHNQNDSHGFMTTNNYSMGMKEPVSPMPFTSDTTSSMGFHNSFMMHSHPDFTDFNGPCGMEDNLGNHSDSQPLLLTHQDTVSAPPIQDLYRYHVFFSHCSEDREWVEHMVAHLEAPPFNYTCAYASVQDETDPGTLQQRILCAAMLSERVVLVLSSKYVQDTWFSFEKTLKQLTQMSLHNQRIMGVLLEDCEIPESLGELYFLDSSDPDFFHVFTKRLKTSRIPRSSASVSSDLGQNALAPSNVTNGKILTFCRLHVKVGWESYLLPADDPELDIPPSLSAHGIGMEKTEFGEIVTKVSGIVEGSNKLPWLLSAQPMAALLLAGGLWLPAFIAVLVVHVDDASGIALPIRLAVFLFPLGLVAAGYLIKWRRSYWLTKIVRLLVQNCVDVNQALYFQGRPLFTTAAHVRANIFAIYFVYFDATDCVRSVDLLLFTCMEDDWEKLVRLITFYTRDENYLSRMSISERLTVMMSAPYLVKLVRQMLPHPPQQRHVHKLLCLCQFTEECISRFAHGLDREDVPGLAELFTRHMPGKVSGSAVRRVQEELFHANHGLVP